MPPPPEKPPREAMEQQDQSIKARKRQLFEEPAHGDDHPAVRPFAAYLRDTPPAPLSGGVRATLWAVGVVVVLLFLAALFLPRRPVAPRARHGARAPAAAAPAAITSGGSIRAARERIG